MHCGFIASATYWYGASPRSDSMVLISPWKCPYAYRHTVPYCSTSSHEITYILVSVLVLLHINLGDR